MKKIIAYMFISITLIIVIPISLIHLFLSFIEESFDLWQWSNISRGLMAVSIILLVYSFIRVLIERFVK